MMVICSEQIHFFFFDEDGQRKGDLLYVLTVAFLRFEFSYFSWALMKVLHNILTAPDYALSGL